MNLWGTTASLLARHLSTPVKLDVLLEGLPSPFTAADRRRCRHLLYGTVRHRALLDHAVNQHLRRPARPLLHATLLLGAFELLDEPDLAPAIVHHAVERTRELTSPPEAGVVNAVLRRVPASLREVLDRPAEGVKQLALRFSHPEWLVARWMDRWGDATARQLLEWNQQPASIYARVTSLGNERLPAFFQPTLFPGFYRLERPDWDEVERRLAAGSIYVQNPATALAPGLLAIAAGEIVLDLCAAPGGKTLQLASRAGPTGRVVAVDLASARLERLRENLTHHAALPVTVLAADVATLTGATFAAADLPESYDAVLLDVPCSNTGVLRHRVDAKWRLQPRDLAQLPPRQLELLRRAAELVRPGGRLVYSTCSLEPEENEDVAACFVAEAGGAFTLEKSSASRPWQSGCDGAWAARFTRGSPPR